MDVGNPHHSLTTYRWGGGIRRRMALRARQDDINNPGLSPLSYRVSITPFRSAVDLGDGPSAVDALQNDADVHDLRLSVRVPEDVLRKHLVDSARLIVHAVRF